MFQRRSLDLHRNCRVSLCLLHGFLGFHGFSWDSEQGPHCNGAYLFAGAPASQENSMAVQQNKKSPSKRGMHRSHNALTTPGTAVESTTGEIHMRHHISPTGFYRGRKVLKTKADA